MSALAYVLCTRADFSVLHGQPRGMFPALTRLRLLVGWHSGMQDVCRGQIVMRLEVQFRGAYDFCQNLIECNVHQIGDPVAPRKFQVELR